MTLVERFIEFNHWPTSRKVAFISGLILPFHFLGWAVVHFSFAQLSIINVLTLDRLMAVWTGLVVLCFLVSLPLALTGKEARWTAYLFALPYITVTVALIYLLGSASTALLALVPVFTLFWALYFDETLAGISLLYGASLLVLVGYLESRGVLPYAPVLLERTIDAQRNDVWFAVGYFVVFQVLIIAFVISILVVRAQRLQEARLADAHQQLERSSQLIRRYVPSQVADAILAGREETASRHERRKLTIFFSDLVGFTEIAEELEPEDLSRVLNEYFSEMTAIAQKHGGTVDELSGDAILIFFGAPVATDDKDHALRAARMAIEMQQAMAGLNAKWRGAGITEALQVRVGINTGVVTIGNFGSPERMKYAALGKHVNLAARLQAQSEPGKVLLSHATWLLVHEQIQCTQKGEMQLKGIQRP
ncbi:MAG: adenylate/guanylate cyclase domain-containing protein, partial [Burkholderiales bacterium]